METKINFIAIDDDILGLMSIGELAKRYVFLQPKGYFSNASDGLVAINSLKPDLIFFDIEMPGITGLELLRLTKEKVPMAIFVTSHPEFALDGFELSALDYLLKPVDEERFEQAMRRVQDYWEMKQKAAAYEVMVEKEYLLIKEGRNQIRLPQQDVIYLEAMQDYTKLVTQKKTYMINKPLSGFVAHLPLDKFLRIHRSYAVALHQIIKLGLGEVVCYGCTLPIGKTYRSAVAQIKL